MIAKNWLLLDNNQTVFLPATVVAELELNSVIPPPDMIKEEKQQILVANPIRKSLIHIPQPNVWSHLEDLQQQLPSSSREKWPNELKTR